MYLSDLQQDEIFVSSEMKPLKSLTGMEPRRGMENAIISNGKIVNVVSKSYGYISNELFFGKAEQMLVDANLNYRKRTINRMDRSFIIGDNNQFSLRNRQDKFYPCCVSRILMMEVKKPLDILAFIVKLVQTVFTFLTLR